MRSLWISLGLALGLLAVPASAQTALFTEEAPLELTLQGPLGTLIGNAVRNTNPYPATLTLTNAGAAQDFAIQVRARGITRRRADVCQIPPLLLDFDNQALRGTLFQGQNHLKLVSYCRAPANYEQRIILEYTAYRLYNLMTPLSYRVRAAQVTYHDTGGRRGDVSRLGFLIEDIDDVARRNHRVELEAEPTQLSFTQLEPRASVRYALFQLMIGNLDWDYVRGPPGSHCCHNSKVLAAEGATTNLTPIPYDFDFSGFVDAPYATPPPNIPITGVRTRYYRGLCMHNSEIAAVAGEFRAHRTEIAALINTQSRLTEDTRTKALRYVDGFFAVLDDPSRVEREIIRRCRD